MRWIAIADISWALDCQFEEHLRAKKDFYACVRKCSQMKAGLTHHGHMHRGKR